MCFPDIFDNCLLIKCTFRDFGVLSKNKYNILHCLETGKPNQPLLVSCGSSILVELKYGNVWFQWRGANLEKNPREFSGRSRTQATLVRGERSHHFPAPHVNIFVIRLSFFRQSFSATYSLLESLHARRSWGEKIDRTNWEKSLENYAIKEIRNLLTVLA